MDKETLSNYGWIVICVMVLAVMLALATPFGSFVAGAVKSTTAGLFDVNQNALDIAGIVLPDQEFDDPTGGEAGGNNTPDATPEINEHGFYCGVVYYGEVRDDGRDPGHTYVKDYAVIFQENGKAMIFEDTTAPATILQVDNVDYQVNGNQISLDNGGVTLIISADGKSMKYNEVWNVYFGSISMRTDIPTTGVKYETVYTEAWDENVTVVFHSDNTVTYTDAEGNVETLEVDSWTSPYRCSVRGFGVIRLGLTENKVSCDIR